MPISQKERKALESLISHVRHDIRYGAGGTFAKDPGFSDDVDTAEVKKVEGAINLIIETFNL